MLGFLKGHDSTTKNIIIFPDTGEKPFCCDHCGMNFRQKDGLKVCIQLFESESPVFSSYSHWEIRNFSVIWQRNMPAMSLRNSHATSAEEFCYPKRRSDSIWPNIKTWKLKIKNVNCVTKCLPQKEYWPSTWGRYFNEFKFKLGLTMA